MLFYSKYKQIYLIYFLNYMCKISYICSPSFTQFHVIRLIRVYVFNIATCNCQYFPVGSVPDNVHASCTIKMRIGHGLHGAENVLTGYSGQDMDFTTTTAACDLAYRQTENSCGY